MKIEILEDLAKGNWGFTPRSFILGRVIKFVTVCLIFTLLFWLILLEDYTTLFFLLGGISGFLIFIIQHFLENRFGKDKLRESPENLKEIRKPASLEQSQRKSTVGD